MKVTVNNADKQQEKPFPKLMTCKDGVIYYFIRKGYGLPIVNWNEIKWEEFKTLSAGAWDGEEFTDFNGSITLSND